MNSITPKIIISGGGTGGHVFPAIAIANAIKELRPDADILFVGANGKMEMERVPLAGYKIKGLDVVGLQRKLTLANLAFPFKLYKSLQAAKAIVKEFQPDVAVGVGGYASGPTLRMAEKLGVPSLLQEQNSYPGLTNKLLAKRAATICVAYENMDRFFPANKIVHTGNPVRKEVVQIEGKKEEALSFFGLSPDKPVLLVIGGSLGARTINESIKACLSQLQQEGVQVIWQTGRYYFEEIQAYIKDKNNEGLWVNAFINRMDLAYAAADMIVSRAGAMSISEICLVGKPTIFVPSPNVAEDHQTKNAMSLVDKEAAMLVKDIDAVQKLGSGIVSLIKDKDKRDSLSAAVKLLGKPNADESIAKEVLKLIKNKGV
jgi:UDP-N-acetylglucosamine--N-acetylmuramyl-(pentapeptide) pyrophosphoryl-undecaprenol N-acetylglucosamine transferase